jgi:HK97 family phage prohead protease
MPKPSKKATIKRSSKGREIHMISKPSKLEVRSNADGSRSISGYGVVWNSLSQDMGNWKEKIAPGAFTESLKTINPDPMILYSHDDASILGRVSSGTATIREDSTGVRFVCKLPATGPARDLIALAERGDLRSCSFGFSVPDGGDEWQEVGNLAIRTVTKAVLWEISIVGQPAYSASSFNLRGCPVALRSKLRRNDAGLEDDPESDDDESDDENGCDCDCPEYLANQTGVSPALPEDPY